MPRLRTTILMAATVALMATASARADIAIGVTAASMNAVLLTRNTRDFAGIPTLTLESAE